MPLRWTADSAKLTGALALISASLVISYRFWSPSFIQRQKSGDYEEAKRLDEKYGSDTVIIRALPLSVKMFSPFTTKMETFLRVNRLRYVLKSDNNFMSSVPWIAYGGQVYDNVDEAIRAISIKNGIEMDSCLSPSERAVSRSIQMMLEHHLYWLILVERWRCRQHHEQGQLVWLMAPLSSSSFSWFSTFLVRRAASSVASKIEAMSSLLSNEEVERGIRGDLRALDDFLENKTFVMGKQAVTQLDCSLVAFLMVLDASHLKKYPRCIAYLQRMVSLYFPHYCSTSHR